jgi:hypothetical protein
LNEGAAVDPLKNRLTKVRQEVKYLIEPDLAPRVLKSASERLPLKIVDGSASSYRISIYLDGPGFELARAELNSKGRSIRLRVKDYYTLNDSAPKFSDKYWFEVKARLGTTVEKNRFAVERCDAARTASQGPDQSYEPGERAAQEAFEMVRAGRELKPLFVTHYRRTTLQDVESKLRITFDDHVTFHMPVKDIFREKNGCTRGDLPPPLFVEPKWIIEVKSMGTVPAWVEEMVRPAKQVDYSKFAVGVRELQRRGLLDVAQ